MTKTNLEIEFDEWYKNQKEMNPYIMRDWFISKLQQRMDEIVMELPLIDKAHTYASENADEYRAYEAGQEDYKSKVLNIIKSVDKNKNND